LIAGIKKDVVLSGKISRDANKPDKGSHLWLAPTDGIPYNPCTAGISTGGWIIVMVYDWYTGKLKWMEMRWTIWMF